MYKAIMADNRANVKFDDWLRYFNVRQTCNNKHLNSTVLSDIQ